MSEVVYRVKPPLGNAELNALLSVAWLRHKPYDFTRTLAVCLTYVGAFTQDGALVGFTKVAWDGDTHGFLLDPTVHPHWRRQGIGRELVRLAVEEARKQGLEWLHVDFEGELQNFYAGCGFVPTLAGLINLVTD